MVRESELTAQIQQLSELNSEKARKIELLKLEVQDLRRKRKETGGKKRKLDQVAEFREEMIDFEKGPVVEPTPKKIEI